MAVAMTALFFVAPKTGLGTWGMNKTVGRAWDINFYLPYILAALLLLAIIIASLVLVIKQSGSK